MKSTKRCLLRNTCILFLCLELTVAVFAESKTYTVQKGDTLYSISKKNNLSVSTLLAANAMSDSSVLKVGQILTIPDQDCIYTVQKGDTLYGISRTYGLSVSELLAMNSLKKDTTLKIGQTLVVPGDYPKEGIIASTAGTPETDAMMESVQDMKITDPRTYSAKKGDSSLVWPVKTTDVTYVTGKVSGVSLTTNANEKVSAIKAGTVMFSGLYRGFGQVVFVQSAEGQIYVYTGLDELSVQKGANVKYGDKLGTVGVDTISGKPQVNLMVFKNGKPVDPAKAPRG